MKKKASFSFFVKFLFPVPAVLLLVLVVSCKSSPAPEPEALPEEPEQSLPMETRPQEEPVPASGDTEASEAGPDSANGEEGGGEFAGDGLPDSVQDPESDEGPETIIPPEAPAESQPELPEPEVQAFEPPVPVEVPDLPLPRDPEFPAGEIPTVPPAEPVPPPEAAEAPEPPERSVPATPAPAVPEPEPSEPPPPTPSPPERREAPEPPSFLGPAEPETLFPPRELPPAPVNPIPDLPARTAPEAAGEDIVFSRIVRATVGQLIEIPFRGTGWVYLGELGNRRGLGYESRRLDLSGNVTEGQSFIFRSELTGTYILKFYKQDFIQDYIINDHVQVIVGEGPDYERSRYPSDPGRVVAEPRWPPAREDAAAPLPAAEAPGSEVSSPESVEDTPFPEAADSTGIGQPVPESGPEPESTPVVPSPVAEPQNSPPEAAALEGTLAEPAAGQTVPDENSPLEEYLRMAKAEFDAGRIEAALNILDSMKRRFPLGADEAWWLYGQLLEANTPSRDIRLAREYYRRLVSEYPQSARAGDAQRRIAYLERYYFNIR